MQFLRHNGICHRDFKPNNLLVSGSLNDVIIKVVDFDDVVAIKQTIMATVTQINFLKGMTLVYTAPELCFRKVRSPNAKTDIYLWAVPCFEILNNYPGAWINVLPVMNDHLLLKALESNERPSELGSYHNGMMI